MSLIPAENRLLLVEEEASMNNWELFIENASKAIIKDLEDKEKAYKLKLAYEELISNIIRAASDQSIAHNVTLKVYCLTSNFDGKKLFTLQTEDNGIAYDPGFNKENTVDVDQEISEREIGGLGIFLIKQSVDQASYERINGFNTNQLSMQIN